MKKRLQLAKFWYIGLIVTMLAYIPGQAVAQVFDETDGFTNETVWTVDSDNTGAGVDVDIVANQGSDLDGTLRYNATTNQWELSNDGGAFSPIATSNGSTSLDGAYDFGGAGAGRTIAVDSGAVVLSGTGSLLELGDGTASDLTITFNENITDGTLTWDNTNDEFDFSNNVNVTGTATTSGAVTVGTTLSVNGPSATLDADNIGAGDDVDLVANQGADSDGTLRYNSTANQWEISNDGGAFNAITTSATDADTQNTLDSSYDEGGAGAGRTITVDSGAVVLSGTGFLLEMGNGTAADSVITFNDGSNRNMGWDDSQNAISTFATDFIAGGNFEVNGTVTTLDANNVAGGADVSIVANQGLDSDGTIRYDATANEWQVSNDGGAFNALTTSATDTDTQNTLDSSYDEGGAGAGRTITVDSGAVVLSGTGFLLEMGNGTAADSVITFNDGSNRNMGWDDSQGAISTFVTDFIAGGNLEVNGTVTTLDANNVAGGADVSIVANQGLDSDGTIRYDATANEWQVANDGGSFAAIATGNGPTSNDFVFAYDTTTQSVASANTFQDVTFNTNGQLDGWTHTASSADFTAGVTGFYQAIVSANIESISGEGDAEIRALFNGTEVAGSQVSVFVKSADTPHLVSRSFLFDAVAGQILKIQFTSGITDHRLIPAGGNATTAPSITLSVTRLN